MTVYAVSYFEDFNNVEESTLMGIFSAPEKAENFIEKIRHRHSNYNGFNIDEFVLDKE